MSICAPVHIKAKPAAAIVGVKVEVLESDDDHLTGDHSNERLCRSLSKEQRRAFNGESVERLCRSLTKDAGPKIDDRVPALERELQNACGKDGFLLDVVECFPADLAAPEAVAPWKDFDCHLYRSPAATAALRSILRCAAPGTSNSFQDILSAISEGPAGCPMCKHQSKKKNYCYLVGGQVRDVLRGKLSVDIDVNYSCSAQEVAQVTVARGWPTKFKIIGDGVATPNYVLIGDENNECYLEGFCVDFNLGKLCTNDLTMNQLVYDLTNDIIIDKCNGVADIRAGALRLTLAPGESFEAWAIENFTPGNKELRYIKFFLRAEAKCEPLTYDAAECAFIVKSLRTALRTNERALGDSWLGYTLKAQMKDSEGVRALRDWVDKHGGPHWWDEQWVPLVRKCAAPGALRGAEGDAATPKATDRRSCWLRCMRQPRVVPETE